MSLREYCSQDLKSKNAETDSEGDFFCFCCHSLNVSQLTSPFYSKRFWYDEVSKYCLGTKKFMSSQSFWCHKKQFIFPIFIKMLYAQGRSRSRGRCSFPVDEFNTKQSVCANESFIVKQRLFSRYPRESGKLYSFPPR